MCPGLQIQLQTVLKLVDELPNALAEAQVRKLWRTFCNTALGSTVVSWISYAGIAAP